MLRGEGVVGFDLLDRLAFADFIVGEGVALPKVFRSQFLHLVGGGHHPPYHMSRKLSRLDLTALEGEHVMYQHAVPPAGQGVGPGNPAVVHLLVLLDEGMDLRGGSEDFLLAEIFHRGMVVEGQNPG